MSNNYANGDINWPARMARRARRAAWGAAPLALIQAAGAGPALASAAPPAALFAEKWIDGVAAEEPDAQVQALDGDTFVIRQSIKTNFEAPFLYLMFGRDKALLIDSGAEGGRIRPVVDRLVEDWAKKRGRKAAPPLVVAHSHSHGDHVAGDSAFRNRPDTTVVGLKPEDVARFFGVAPWPNVVARYDLGGRALSVIPTPGHQAAAIAIYDPQLKILLTGDSLYPGRLYAPVNFLADYRASVDRLAAFAVTRPVRAVLGAHIEMTRTPGKDYPQEASQHPDEHRLELPASSIEELRAGLTAPLDMPGRLKVHDSFIIYPVAPRAE